MRYLQILILFLCFVLKFSAQPPAKFYGTWGGYGDDIGYSGKQTKDGNYIVAGSTSSYGHGEVDVYLLKIDSMGLVIWDKTFGGFNSEVGKSVIELADSGYVIAGFTSSFGAGGYDAYLIRTNKNGNLIWQKTFGGTDWDFANDLVLGSDGNLYVVGYTYSYGAGKKDGFVLKYDLLGNLISQKFFGGAEDDELNSIIKTNDGFLATIGYTKSKGDLKGDAYFLKLDLNGDTLFTRTFGGPGIDYGSDLVQRYNSQYMLCGAKTFSTDSNTHSYMYRMTGTGTFIDDRDEFRNGGDEFFVSACLVKDTNKTGFVRTVSFPSDPFKKKQADIYVCEPTGYPYIVNDSGGSADELAYSLDGTKDGGTIITGATYGFGAFGADIYIIKRDSLGLTYSSIVSLPEQRSDETRLTVFHHENTVALNFVDIATVKEINLYNLSGSLLRKINSTSKMVIIDLENYPTSVYLIEVRFSNSSSKNIKVIR